ncbi:MAG: macro domain-containing protein [Trueperaceae bacterium]|nr:macro domain-containing protein [Trueperaceae bacterium]
MPNDSSTNSSNPIPVVGLTPEKPALPAAGGTLDCLLEISVALPAASSDRHPIDLALVIDRSGSMSGAPLEAAKAAAREAVNMLLPGDRVAVVTFDDSVYVPVPLTDVGTGTALINAAIGGIGPGGSTNLFGGWAEGMSQVINSVSKDRVTRVALLSDGQANAGVTDRGQIAADIAEAARLGVSTSAFGFGRNYDEALLRMVADAGVGNYYFIEDASQTVDAFQQELASVSALRGHNVQLAVQGSGVSLRLPRDEAHAARPGFTATSVALPPLIGGLPFDSLVTLELQPGASLTGIAVSWDDALSGKREELRLPLALEAVSPAQFASLPSDERVVAMRRAIDIANLKRRAAEAAERNDVGTAHAVLEQVRSAVAALPSGATKDEETAELARLLHHVNDMAMLAKRAHYGSHMRFESKSPEKMRAMRDHEMELMTARKQRIARETRGGGAPTSHAPAPAPTNISTTEQQTRIVTAANGRQVTVQAVTGDIVSEQVDALVNSTNRSMFGTGGVDGAIHKAGGKELTAAVRSIGSLSYCTAVFTPGFDLGVRFVIHVATPLIGHGGEATLARCYHAVFELAERLGVTSISVPLIGAGQAGARPEIAEQMQEAAVAAWLARSNGPCRLVRLIGLTPRQRPLTLGVEATPDATPDATVHN